MIAITKFKLIPGALRVLRHLRPAGRKIAQIETAGLSDQVLLRPA